jgi:glycosyltransferase involved in cell wall biosynthesis
VRLLFVTQVVDDGDAVLGFLPTWLRELAARVEALTVVAFQLGAMPAFPKNVEVRTLGRERGRRGAALLLAFRSEVRRAVRERGCDTVLVHMVPKYAVLARRLAVPRRIPIYLWYTHAGVNRWLRWSEPLVEKIFTASEESLTIETHKKVVTRHGIDVGFLRPDAGQTPAAGKLVTVGRFTPSKDVEFLLRALAALRGAGARASLDVIGDGLVPSDAEYRERMLALRRELGLEEAARFEGAIPYKKIPPIYRGGAIFVSASRTGSVDKAILEAMACGTPVLTSNASFRAILPPDHIFAERSIEDFVAKAKNILGWDPARRAREGARLRAIVERDHAVAPLMDRLVSEMAPRAAAVGGPP